MPPPPPRAHLPSVPCMGLAAHPLRCLHPASLSCASLTFLHPPSLPHTQTFPCHDDQHILRVFCASIFSCRRTHTAPGHCWPNRPIVTAWSLTLLPPSLPHLNVPLS